MEWHVDSWAVRDGFAFASYRDAGSMRDAKRTVFIGVPELVPVPIGRVSTALWATRGNFQDRFLDDNGQEIGFLKLEHVIELVRRAYLAGGIGPGPAAGEGAERPGPRENLPGGGDAHFDDGLGQLAPAPAWNQRFHPTGDKDERDARFREILRHQDVIDTLYDYLRVFGEATLIKWAEALTGPGGGADLADFARWQRALYRIGLWRAPGEYLDMVDKNDAIQTVVSAVDPWFPYPYRDPSWPSWMSSPTHEQIVLNVPCPLRPQWSRLIKRLSDKLYLALSTLDYFDINDGLPEFIPALLAALAIVVQTEEERFDWYGDDARRDRLKAALGWLSQEMPQIALPDEAERALTDFAWAELDRR